jgi:hypothetical protein
MPGFCREFAPVAVKLVEVGVRIESKAFCAWY